MEYVFLRVCAEVTEVGVQRKTRDMHSNLFSLECCHHSLFKIPIDCLFCSMYSVPRIIQCQESLHCVTYVSVEEMDSKQINQRVTYFQVMIREKKENNKEEGGRVTKGVIFGGMFR